MAAKIQIAGLFASSRHEEDDDEDEEKEDDEDESKDAAACAANGKGRLRIANASNTRKSATEPRKNGSSLCAAVQATINEQNTAPTPQKKFSRLTAPARELGPALDAISAISKLSDGTISPSPNPNTATDTSPSQNDPM